MGMATSIMRQTFSSLLIRKEMFDVAILILKYHSSLYFSELHTGYGLWSYQFTSLLKPHFLLRFHWITSAVPSCCYNLHRFWERGAHLVVFVVVRGGALRSNMTDNMYFVVFVVVIIIYIIIIIIIKLQDNRLKAIYNLIQCIARQNDCNF